MSRPNHSAKTDKEVSADFTSYYLQRATKEFAEDLDKVRNAEDFKTDGISMLIQALQQGTETFTPEEKRRVVVGESTEKKSR